jgi:hypothetical protein
MRLTSSEQAERVQWSVKEWSRMIFVTATLPQSEQDPKVISSCWVHFVKNLRHLYPSLRVIRVLQKHPGGHGWHVHALFDRYIPAQVILHQANLSGLGRMDFQRVANTKRIKVVQYICRYISRDLRKRDKLSKGVRLLTAAGHLRCTVRWWRRYVDCYIETNTKSLRASLCGILETMGIVLDRNIIDSTLLFGYAPPAALAELRRLHPGAVY